MASLTWNRRRFHHEVTKNTKKFSELQSGLGILPEQNIFLKHRTRLPIGNSEKVRGSDRQPVFLKHNHGLAARAHE
jgi:hypothetical protein